MQYHVVVVIYVIHSQVRYSGYYQRWLFSCPFEDYYAWVCNKAFVIVLGMIWIFVITNVIDPDGIFLTSLILVTTHVIIIVQQQKIFDS